MNCPYVMRRCNKCGEVKFLFKFCKNKKNKYGFENRCKECKLKYEKKYAQSEKGKEVQKKYYQSEKGKEVQKKAQKKYAQSEKGQEAYKKYNQSEKGQVASFNSGSRRRKREESQGNDITKPQWREMMNFFEWKCAYSGMQLNKKNRSIDHIIALNNGGLNEIWNCVPMYKPYNSSKKTSDMLEWYQQQDFYSEERLQKIYEWQEYAYNKWGKEGEVCLH